MIWTLVLFAFLWVSSIAIATTCGYYLGRDTGWVDGYNAATRRLRNGERE